MYKANKHTSKLRIARAGITPPCWRPIWTETAQRKPWKTQEELYIAVQKYAKIQETIHFNTRSPEATVRGDKTSPSGPYTKSCIRVVWSNTSNTQFHTSNTQGQQRTTAGTVWKGNETG